MHHNCPACFSGSHLELHWLNPPRKILVVAKPSPDVLRSLVRVAEWLLDPQRAMHVYVEPSVYARLGLVSKLPHQPFHLSIGQPINPSTSLFISSQCDVIGAALEQLTNCTVFHQDNNTDGLNQGRKTKLKQLLNVQRQFVAQEVGMSSCF